MRSLESGPAAYEAIRSVVRYGVPIRTTYMKSRQENRDDIKDHLGEAVFNNAPYLNKGQFYDNTLYTAAKITNVIDFSYKNATIDLNDIKAVLQPVIQRVSTDQYYTNVLTGLQDSLKQSTRLHREYYHGFIGKNPENTISNDAKNEQSLDKLRIDSRVENINVLFSTEISFTF